MVDCRGCLVSHLLCSLLVFQSVSTQFDDKCDAIAEAERLNDSLKNTRENILHYYEEIVSDGDIRNRSKRYDVTEFRGRPKTREERWHVNFNVNNTNLEYEQTQSLVTLLNKVVNKYLHSCVPIILYDKFVEHSEGIVLQTFFRVTSNSFLFSSFSVVHYNELSLNRRASTYRIYMGKSMRITPLSIRICCIRLIKNAVAIFYFCRMWCAHEMFWDHKLKTG